jgi:virginiamycin B lyase
MSPGGVFTAFAVPTAGSQPAGIAAGPDGTLWFTELNGPGTEDRAPLPHPHGATTGPHAPAPS